MCVHLVFWADKNVGNDLITSCTGLAVYTVVKTGEADAGIVDKLKGVSSMCIGIAAIGSCFIWRCILSLKYHSQAR